MGQVWEGKASDEKNKEGMTNGELRLQKSLEVDADIMKQPASHSVQINGGEHKLSENGFHTSNGDSQKGAKLAAATNGIANGC